MSAANFWRSVKPIYQGETLTGVLVEKHDDEFTMNVDATLARIAEFKQAVQGRRGEEWDIKRDQLRQMQVALNGIEAPALDSFGLDNN